MRIWIDIAHSPHVRFFARLIRELRSEHNVIVSARLHANTAELLKQERISHQVVGRHYGASRLRKAAGVVIRTLQLYRAMRSHPPDVAVAHSSYYLPLSARLLGVPSIYLNDNEHFAGNYIAFPAATRILVPEYFPDQRLAQQNADPSKVVRYPGVKEGVYLWPEAETGRDNEVVGAGDRPQVFVRPEPWSAEYYTGDTDFLNTLLSDMSSWADITILPRDEHQARRYAGLGLPSVRVAKETVTLEELRSRCDLFVGAGGTMTREAAVLGLLSVSVYQSELLAVDHYLVNRGLIHYRPRLTANEARQLLRAHRKGSPDPNLLKRGREAYVLIRQQVLDLGGKEDST